MICSSCLRDVPDLTGPRHDVCPTCYGVAAEDYFPSVHDPWCDGDCEGEELQLAEPWYLEDLLSGIEADLTADLDDGDLLLDPPCFHGRRRF
jgi:hypothetical protein